jgi:membrane protease YdiL (CAAX protease family)
VARVSLRELVTRAKRLGIALAWIVAFAVVAIGASVVLNTFNPVTATSPWWLAANSGGQAIAFLTATWLVGSRLNKHSWDQMGWHTGGGEGLRGRIARGVARGALMAALAIGLSFIASGARVQLTGDWGRWLALAPPLAVGLVLAALTEELGFRGYPLRRLAEAVGPWAAMIVLVVPFGLLHLKNPHATFFSTVNVMLAGVWLSFAFFSHGGMGYAWGLHFGWNAGLALAFDAPVSGYEFHVPAVEYTPGHRAWVDGGAFGPEGGIVATIVLIAGTLALIGSRFTQPRTWLAG